MATENELGSDNIRDTHWLGEVVDNNDPKNNGRCRVKVYGKFDNLTNDAIPWASPSNSMAPGQHIIPNKGDIVSITFDNGNIYTPTYSYQINQSPELKNDILNGSAEPQNVVSLIYDIVRNFRFYLSKEDGLVMTTGADKNSQPMIRFSPDGKMFLNADQIFIASNSKDEAEPAVKGETLRKLLDSFMASFLSHTHPTGTGPSGPPLPPEKAQVTETKGKLDTIKQYKAGGGSSSTPTSSSGSSGTSGTSASTSGTSGTTGTSGTSAASTSGTSGTSGTTTSTGGSGATYSTEDEIILDANGAPQPISGITSGDEVNDTDVGKNKGNDTSTTFYNRKFKGIQSTSIINAVDYTLKSGEAKSLCSRYTSNIARNYVAGLHGKKMIPGATFPANGNANGKGYFATLESIGYKKIAGGSNISKSQLASILSQDFDIGDVVCYWATDGSTADSCRQYGHTQIFTGGLHTRSNGHKWSTDTRNNFDTYFVYKSKPASTWNLLIFKAPQV